NLSWRRPANWIAELFRHEPQIETELERMTFHAAESLGKCLSIAMQAPGADLRAAAHRIPGCIRPFDFRIVAHDAKLCEKPYGVDVAGAESASRSSAFFMINMKGESL